jgi:hypothetical protein
VEHEGVGLPAQIAGDELDALHHEPGDEVYVAGQPVQLRDDDRAGESPGRGQRLAEFGPPGESIGYPLARLDLGERVHEIEPFSFRKRSDGLGLGLEPQARPPLLAG